MYHYLPFCLQQVDDRFKVPVCGNKKGNVVGIFPRVAYHVGCNAGVYAFFSVSQHGFAARVAYAAFRMAGGAEGAALFFLALGEGDTEGGDTG